jgi:hypothetical protein
MMRKLIALFLVGVMLLVLAGCGAASRKPDPERKVIRELEPGVYEVEPLSEPILASASRIAYDEAHMFSYCNFIFKGRIEKITEIEFTAYNDFQGHYPIYYTIYDVTPIEIIAGELQEPKSKVRVSSGNSSRLCLTPYFEMVVGQEYYLGTRMFDDEMIANNTSGSHKYADVRSYGYRGIFPVSSGVALAEYEHTFAQNLLKRKKSARSLPGGVASQTSAEAVSPWYSQDVNAASETTASAAKPYAADLAVEDNAAIQLAYQTEGLTQRELLEKQIVAEKLSKLIYYSVILIEEADLRDNLIRLHDKYAIS